MDERVERLLSKAEAAIDRSETDNAEAYAMLASRTAYLQRREVKMLNRQFAITDNAT